MKLNTLRILAIVLLSSFVVSCSALKELATMSKCTFRMKNLQNANIAGVNIQGKTSWTQFGLRDAAKITLALSKGKLPLSFTLNIDAKNPNPINAAMSHMEWIAFIDDTEIARGATKNRIEIAANNGVTTIPLDISVDLKKIINKDSKDALVNFGLNLADAGNQPTRVSLKIKPTINIGSIPITYPGYFTVKKEFGAN